MVHLGCIAFEASRKVLFGVGQTGRLVVLTFCYQSKGFIVCVFQGVGLLCQPYIFSYFHPGKKRRKKKKKKLEFHFCVVIIFLRKTILNATLLLLHGGISSAFTSRLFIIMHLLVSGRKHLMIGYKNTPKEM